MSQDSAPRTAARAARSTPASGESRPGPAQMLIFYISCGFPISLWMMGNFLVPLRARELGASHEFIGLLVGMGSVLGTLGAVPAGALSDRIGPRRSFALGALLSAVGAFALASTDNLWAMLVIQFFRGFPHSISWVSSQAYATSIGSAADRAVITGRFSFATNVGSLIAPLAMGAVAQQWGYQSGFVALGIFALLHVGSGLLFAEVRARRSPVASSSGLGGFAEAKAQMSERSTQVAMLLTFVRIWITNSWIAFFPVYLKEQGFEEILIGTVLTANGLVGAVMALTAHWFARRSSNEVATAGALALGALGMALSPLVPLVPLVYGPALFMGSGTGLSMPLVMAILSDAVPPERRGVAMGLRTTANQAASVVSPIVVGVLVTSAGLASGFLLSAVIAWSMLGTALSLHFAEGRRLRRSTALE